MGANIVLGTQGYGMEAENLFIRYEKNSFDEKHVETLKYLPPKGSFILDIGSGTGKDASYFAENGYTVTAVEPTKELREGAKKRHAHNSITWIDDSLPELKVLKSQDSQYDFIMMASVFMHLDEKERAIAIKNIASLLKKDGILFFTTRHGEVPEGRRMFDIKIDEVKKLCTEAGLTLCEAFFDTKSLSHQDATWNKFIYSKTS